MVAEHTSDRYSDSFHCVVQSPYNSTIKHSHYFLDSLDLLPHHQSSCSSVMLQGFTVHSSVLA